MHMFENFASMFYKVQQCVATYTHLTCQTWLFCTLAILVCKCLCLVCRFAISGCAHVQHGFCHVCKNVVSRFPKLVCTTAILVCSCCFQKKRGHIQVAHLVSPTVSQIGIANLQHCFCKLSILVLCKVCTASTWVAKSHTQFCNAREVFLLQTLHFACEQKYYICICFFV